jgi:D-serine deaminase-like pyridoxal phosphate-dependent protein
VTPGDLSTPALLVDVQALDRNIRRMAEFFAEGSCQLRPHVKAHKTPEIARRQLAAGSCSGLTCATVGEAEAVAHLGADLLIANEIVDSAKCDRIASLARTQPVTVAVDSGLGVEALAAAARRAGVKVGVLIDLDVGQRRCGVVPGQEALTLAHLAAEAPGLELRGVMGYEGHVQPIRRREERAASAEESMRVLVATAELLLRAGLPCDIVSGGGTCPGRPVPFPSGALAAPRRHGQSWPS